MDENKVDLTEYNGDSLVATCVTLLLTSWIAVGLRSYTRVVLMKSYQADDWLMLIAQVSPFNHVPGTPGSLLFRVSFFADNCCL